jgi:hypothetical protein
MAIKQSATFRNTVPNGTYGTISKTVGSATFAGDDTGTEVHVIRLEAGTKIFGLKVHHGNLGAGTSLMAGFAYVDSADGAADDRAFGSGVTTALGAFEYVGLPITLNAPAIITITSGGTATGEVTVIPEYEYRGV